MALHLARKDNRIELEVRAGIRKVGHLPGGKDVLFPVGVDIDDSFFPKPIEVVWLRTLVGAVPPITHIYWRPVPWRKREFRLTPAANKYSYSLPATLDDGKAVEYCWSLTEFVYSPLNGRGDNGKVS